MTSQVALVVKNQLANAGDIRDLDLIPGSGRFPGGGHGNPLLQNQEEKQNKVTKKFQAFGEGNDNPFQYSCLGNPMDSGAWQVTVHRVTKNQTQPKQLSMP